MLKASHAEHGNAIQNIPAPAVKVAEIRLLDLQLMIARQLNQQPGQLPLQRLTQEQMQQVQQRLRVHPGQQLGLSQVLTDTLKGVLTDHCGRGC